MKLFFIILVLFLTHSIALCQTHSPKSLRLTDSIRWLIRQTPQNTRMAVLLIELADNYLFYKTDSSLIIAQEAIQLSRSLHFTKGEIRALISAGQACRFLGEVPPALEYQFTALEMSRNSNDIEEEASSLNVIGFNYLEMNEYREGLNYLYRAQRINEPFSNKLPRCVGLSYIGHAYEKMNMLDSALFFQQQAYLLYNQFLKNANIGSVILARLGLIQFRLGNADEALRYYDMSLQRTYALGDIINLSKAQYAIAQLYDKSKQPDSSLHYARLAFASAGTIFQKAIMFDASSLMVKLYKGKLNIDSAFHYQEIAMRLKDSLYGGEKFKQLQLITVKEQQRQKELQQEQERYKNKIRMYAIVGVLALFLFLSIFLYRNNRHKQKANALLQLQKEEIDQQKTKAEKALEELKVTQSQLIQSEKMASLGALTAGIAHEIQNPLNFVNNFSEINSELIRELEEEADNENIAEIKSIAHDLKENEEKINHHGKRADAIVKGMLQHSRRSSDKKEPTDINALADEYLRLSYHGLRAKDKDFNADFKTDFDASIGKIEVVPQDIGRVLLNLYNNAFYAVDEKKKQLKGLFKPTVLVSTKRTRDKVEIAVKDNGNGIPQKVVDNIFQPFFTTKPTGQGTGLGLSLSYDIIKAHGGEISVESKEGEGAEFIIRLPVNGH